MSLTQAASPLFNVLKIMRYIAQGFLFSLGLIPVVIFSIWLFHNWPLTTDGLEDPDEFFFDKSQIHLGELTLSRTEDGIRGLGEVTNRSGKPCGFMQLECDLLHAGEIVAHEMAVVSNLGAQSTRGYTVFFRGVPDEVDPAKLKAQVAIAQAFNLKAESDGETDMSQPVRPESNHSESAVGAHR